MGSADMVVIMFIVAIIVFFALREVFCWYYKINARVEKADKIYYELVRIREALEEKMKI